MVVEIEKVEVDLGVEFLGAANLSDHNPLTPVLWTP